MLKCGSVIEAENPPEVIHTLSVYINSSDKERLIIDLRYVNNYIYIDTIRFDKIRLEML